jgi:hypothetical protein
MERVGRMDVVSALKWILLKKKQAELMEQAIEDAKADHGS